MVLKKSITKSKAEGWQEKLFLIGAEAAIIPFVDTKQVINSFQPDSKTSSIRPKANYSQTNLGESTIEEGKMDVREEAETNDQPLSELEMEQRIRHAESLIAAQRVTDASSEEGLGNITNLLRKGFILASVLLCFLYFYISLID
ncbi:MAG: hypothetical protein L3J46_03230 [Kangiellaceae bacterium]|nr:hypothetical protein [Kangiellaceae bacterium]